MFKAEIFEYLQSELLKLLYFQTRLDGMSESVFVPNSMVRDMARQITSLA